MTTVVLLVAFLVFRLLRRPWGVAAGYALAVMLVMTASAHFVPGSVTVMPTHDDLAAMVPPFVPFPSAVVYLTGVLELLGAIGLVTTRWRAPAGICLALMFVLMLPANVYAVSVGSEMASPLWQRIPEQVLYIAFALWAARTARVRRPVMVAV